MSPTYSIRDWQTNFEPSQAKRNTGPLSWVAIPTRHDGKGFRRVMRLPNGPMIYAAWILMLQVAAKCPQRGILADADGPLTAEDLSLKTDCPAEYFEAAMAALVDPKIGWLAVANPECVSEDSPSALRDISETTHPTNQPTNNTNQQYNTNQGVLVSGSLKEKRLPKRGPLAGITEAEMRDTGALIKRHRFLANCAKRYGFDSTPASELTFVAMALSSIDYVARKGGDPVAVFVSAIKAGRRFVGDEHDEAARQLLNEHRAKSNGQPAAFVTAAADQMAVEPISEPEDFE